MYTTVDKAIQDIRRFVLLLHSLHGKKIHTNPPEQKKTQIQEGNYKFLSLICQATIESLGQLGFQQFGCWVFSLLLQIYSHLMKQVYLRLLLTSTLAGW